jgi:FtsZ-binding cell division protein ZapB
MIARMSADGLRRIENLEAQLRRQAAQIGQLQEAVHRLTHENAVLRAERDEARSERDGLRAELDQVRQQHAEAKRQMGELVHALAHSDERLRALVRREFVAASERLIADDTYIPEILAALREDQDAAVVLAPVVVEQATAAADAAEMAKTAATGAAGGKGHRRPAAAGGRKPLPEDIERRHRDYTPPADHPALRNAVGFDTIGSTTIERWHIGKLDLHSECITCPVVRLTLGAGVTCQQTLTPPAVIERGQVSDALLVQSAVDKVADHLPAYRQEQRALRLGVHIPRSKLCRWHIDLAQFVHGVALAIFDEITASPIIGIDDSVHRRQVPDRRVCQQARIWAVSAPVGIFYLFSPTREGAWISDLLAGYRGGVMGDAYSGHNTLLSRDDIIALFCWAHVRRKFHESADAERRRIMLDLIAELYRIEAELTDATPQQRVFTRSAQAKPILARIKTQLDAWHDDPQVLPKSGIGRATAYARKLWPGLERYLTIGNAPIDNNATERGMRRVAMHRKNSLFSASDAGAQGYATLLTVTQSALLHDLDPVAYLNTIIEDIHFDRRPLAELTPQAYARRAKMAEKRAP